MSEIIETVVVVASHAQVASLMSEFPEFVVAEMPGGASLLVRDAPRQDSFDRVRTETLATHAAAHFGCAVAVYYDSRVGHREAVVFAESSRQAFGEESETWVLLNEDGNPDLSGPRFSLAELGPDQEAECIASAIDVALRSLPTDPPITQAMIKSHVARATAP